MRPRKDKRGVDLISDALPFGSLWYAEPDAINNAISYAKFRSRSHDALIRVCDEAGNVIETHGQRVNPRQELAEILLPPPFCPASVDSLPITSSGEAGRFEPVVLDASSAFQVTRIKVGCCGDERFVKARRVNPKKFFAELKRRHVYKVAINLCGEPR